MTEDLSNIHMSKAEFREYGYRLVDWLAEYFDNVDQYQVLPSIEPGDIRKMLPVSAPEGAESMDEIIADLDRVVMPGVAHWQMLSFLRGRHLYLLWVSSWLRV